MKKIYFNLYFLAKNNQTGVPRFAINLLLELDKLFAQFTRQDYVFIGLTPNLPGMKLPDFNQIKIRKVGRISHQSIWEQLVLPFLCLDGFLVNLCNYAPIFKANQLCVIHDCLVFRYPQSYSKKFALINKVFHKCIVKFTRHIITVSNFSKKEIINCIGKPKNEILVLGNSAENFLHYIPDLSILDDYQLKQEQYILTVFSQKNSFYKNVTNFVKAINGLNIKCVCVGNLDQKYLGDNPNIIRVGFVSDNQLKALYANAYAFICPSLYEGFGIPLLEAMASQCPVIASDIEVFREVGHAAMLYFNPYDIADMREKINYLIEHPELRDKFINLGHQITPKYQWHKLAATLLKVII